MSSKWLSRRQTRCSKFLLCFNFKINYKPKSQCKVDALTRKSQDLSAGFHSCQNYMEQVVLKMKNLSTVQPIRILRQEDIISINIMK